MDPALPNYHVLAHPRRLKRLAPGLRVIVLLNHEAEEYREAALADSADATLFLPRLVDELGPTVRACFSFWKRQPAADQVEASP